MDGTMLTCKVHPLEQVLNLVIPYMNLSSMACLASASHASRAWVISSAKLQRGLALGLPNDESCSSSTVLDIIASSSRSRLILGNDVSDYGCVRIKNALGAEVGASFELDARRCFRITDVGLESLFEHHRYSSISLAALWYVNDETIRRMTKTVEQTLRRLDLSGCYRITDISVRELRGLTHFNMEGCVNVKECCTLQILFENNPKLAELNLAGASTLITDETFAILPTMTCLKKLNIDGAYKLTQKGLQDLARIAPNLSWLSMARCKSFTSLEPLLTTIGRALRYLDLNGCQAINEEVSLFCLLEQAEEIDLRHTNISDHTLQQLVTLPRLRSLALSGTLVSDKGMRCFAESRQALDTIMLGSCPDVSFQGMDILFQSQGNSLRTVQLPPNANDHTLAAMCRTCPYLEVVDFGKSFHVSSSGVVSLIRECQTLKVLRLDDTNVDDQVIDCILSCSRNLERVSFYGCENLSNDAILRLARFAGPRLRTILDRHGRLLRCSSATSVIRGSPTTCATGHCADEGKAQVNKSPLSTKLDRIRSVVVGDLPNVAVSCLALVVEWYFSKKMFG